MGRFTKWAETIEGLRTTLNDLRVDEHSPRIIPPMEVWELLVPHMVPDLGLVGVEALADRQSDAFVANGLRLGLIPHCRGSDEAMRRVASNAGNFPPSVRPRAFLAVWAWTRESQDLEALLASFEDSMHIHEKTKEFFRQEIGRIMQTPKDPLRVSEERIRQGLPVVQYEGAL